MTGSRCWWQGTPHHKSQCRHSWCQLGCSIRYYCCRSWRWCWEEFRCPHQCRLHWQACTELQHTHTSYTTMNDSLSAQRIQVAMQVWSGCHKVCASCGSLWTTLKHLNTALDSYRLNRIKLMHFIHARLAFVALHLDGYFMQTSTYFLDYHKYFIWGIKVVRESDQALGNLRITTGASIKSTFTVSEH